MNYELMSILIDYLPAEGSLLSVSRGWLMWCCELPFTIVDPERIDNIPRKWTVIFRQKYDLCFYRIAKLIEAGNKVQMESKDNDRRMYMIPGLHVTYRPPAGRSHISNISSKYLCIDGREDDSDDDERSIVTLRAAYMFYEELVLDGGKTKIKGDLYADKLVLRDGGFISRIKSMGVINCGELHIRDWENVPRITCNKLFMYNSCIVSKVKTSHAVLYFETPAKKLRWERKDIYREASEMLKRAFDIDSIKKIDVVYGSSYFDLSIIDKYLDRGVEIRTSRTEISRQFRCVVSASLLNFISDGEFGIDRDCYLQSDESISGQEDWESADTNAEHQYWDSEDIINQYLNQHDEDPQEYDDYLDWQDEGWDF